MFKWSIGEVSLLTLWLECSSSAPLLELQQTEDKCPGLIQVGSLDKRWVICIDFVSNFSFLFFQTPEYKQDWKCDQKHEGASLRPPPRWARPAACWCRTHPPPSSIPVCCNRCKEKQGRKVLPVCYGKDEGTCVECYTCCTGQLKWSVLRTIVIVWLLQCNQRCMEGTVQYSSLTDISIVSP